MYYILPMFEIYMRRCQCRGLLTVIFQVCDVVWYCQTTTMTIYIYCNSNEMYHDKFYILWLHYQKWIIQVLNK